MIASDAAAQRAPSCPLDHPQCQPVGRVVRLRREPASGHRRLRQHRAARGVGGPPAGSFGELAKRVEALKTLEADRRLQAEHERVLAERDRLAEEMDRLAEPIAQIDHIVSRIAICDREIGRLNATSTSKFGHIRPVLSGAAPAITALFQEGVVWDAFIAGAGLQSLPVAKGKAKVA